jgi:predicted GH43/DUF377 family glycosyl hydrolase
MARVLGVLNHKDSLFLYQESLLNKKKVFTVQKGTKESGATLHDFKIYRGKKLEDLKKIDNFRFTGNGPEVVLFYRSKVGKTSKVSQAVSKDLSSWKQVSDLKYKGISSVSGVPGTKYAFIGTSDGIRLLEQEKKGWSEGAELVLVPRSNYFDFGNLDVGTVLKTTQGIFLFYISTFERKGKKAYCVGLAEFNKSHPNKQVARSEVPLWEQPEDWDKDGIHPIGIALNRGRLTMYWGNKKGETIAVHNPEWDDFENYLKKPHFKLTRHHKNPVIVPHQTNVWETKATFNPAAVYAGGKVHLLYRAIGDNDVSVLGYAGSEDGSHFGERKDDPAYVPRAEFEGRPKGCGPTHVKPTNSPYVSGGGGWGGCEDPRLTQIDDRIYLTYVAYNGWSEPRVALSSISVEDFIAQNWESWSEPVLISKPGEINKNACLFPEKVNGKYVIVHRVFPDMLIDYVDDLNFDGKTKWIKPVDRIKPRRNYWDSRKIGIGPPPIKTPLGWLVIYQGVGEQDPGRYKIGAMLLDLEKPSRVIARAAKPILEPEEHYENGGWKHGVVYPCGAVIINDKLFVYYGGADAYVSVAAADLTDFLNALINKKDIKVEKISSVIISK